MKNLTDSRQVKQWILDRPELLTVYHHELMTSRRARIELERKEAERESEREARLDKLYARLGVERPRPVNPDLLLTAAEAWMRDHSADLENPQTLAEARTMGEEFRKRRNATRRRLKEIGIE